MPDQTSAQAPTASRCSAAGPETGDPCIGVTGHDGGHPFAPEERPIHPASLAWLLDATKIPAEQVWSMVRKCTNEHEPDGNLCPGFIKFGPSDPQAACTTCGAWEGCVAPGWRDRIVGAPAAGSFDSITAAAREKYPEMWTTLRGYVAEAVSQPGPHDAKDILDTMDALKREQLSDVAAAIKAMTR